MMIALGENGEMFFCEQQNHKLPVAVSYPGWGMETTKVEIKSAATLPHAMDSKQDRQTENEKMTSTRKQMQREARTDLRQKEALSKELTWQKNLNLKFSLEQRITFDSLRNMLCLLFGVNGGLKQMASEELFSRYQKRQKEREQKKYTILQEEEGEDLTFYSEGKGRDKEGKETSFHVDAYLSSKLVKQTGFQVDYKKANEVKPLIVCLEALKKIRDQIFFFELALEGENNVRLLERYVGSGDIILLDLFGNRFLEEKREEWNYFQIWKEEENGISRLIAMAIVGCGLIFFENPNCPFFFLPEKETNGAA